MRRIGLTGNIGSGKSTVAKIFEVIGIPVFNADEEAKKLYRENYVKNEMVKEFGSEILSLGEIDMKLLANLVFNNKDLLLKVNSIIHPKVLDSFNIWIQDKEELPYVLSESAIIFENNLQSRYDKIICVSSDVEIRINRVLARDKTNRMSVLERIKNQMTDEEKCSRSDFVIHNNENDMLIPQVLKIHDQISRR